MLSNLRFSWRRLLAKKQFKITDIDYQNCGIRFNSSLSNVSKHNIFFRNYLFAYCNQKRKKIQIC